MPEIDQAVPLLARCESAIRELTLLAAAVRREGLPEEAALSVERSARTVARIAAEVDS